MEELLSLEKKLATMSTKYIVHILSWPKWRRKKTENLVGRWEKEAGTGSVGVAAEADVGVPGVSPGHFRSSAR